MLLSNFELLLKPIAPANTGPAGSDRTILQGYFLTVCNPNARTAYFQLTFVATTPTLNLNDTITIRDVIGNNEPGDLVATADPKKFIYKFSIPAFDTGLVILQPDVTKREVFANQVEIRGYVEIALINPFTIRIINGEPDVSVFLRYVSSGDFLVNPEHRGTFLPKDLKAPNPDFDQLVYSLPTATGGALFKLAV